MSDSPDVSETSGAPTLSASGNPFRSHLTAMGVGFAIAAVVAGALFVAFAVTDGDGDQIITQFTDDREGGDGVGEFVREENDRTVKARWRGEFSLSADGRSVERLDGELKISEKDKGENREVVFEGDGATTRLVSAKAGKTDVSPGDDRDALAGDLVLLFARLSGADAEKRVASLLSVGGVESVLAEIDELQSSYAMRRYMKALLQQAPLSDDDVINLSTRIASLESDYDQRTAIVEIFKKMAAPPDAAIQLLQTTSKMESDYEKRQVLDELSDAYNNSALPTEVAQNVIAVVRGFDSDYEARLSAEALLKSNALKPVDAADLLAMTVEGLESDYETRLLIELASARLDEAPMADVIIEALSEIKGDYELRLVTENVADRLPKESPFWSALLANVGNVSSDRERRLALESVAARMPRAPETVAQYRALASEIDADAERRRALAAIE